MSEFVSQEQLEKEMDELLEHYGADRSQANLERTRKVLGKFKSVNNELASLREENR